RRLLRRNPRSYFGAWPTEVSIRTTRHTKTGHKDRAVLTVARSRPRLHHSGGGISEQPGKRCSNAGEPTRALAARGTGWFVSCRFPAAVSTDGASRSGSPKSRNHCRAQRSGEDARRCNASRGHLPAEDGWKVSGVAGTHAVRQDGRNEFWIEGCGARIRGDCPGCARAIHFGGRMVHLQE